MPTACTRRSAAAMPAAHHLDRPGLGMMGGGSGGGTRGWGTMMGSNFDWMRDGSWQHMRRGDWRRAGGYMMGNGGVVGTSGSGWSAGAVVSVVVAALLLLSLLCAGGALVRFGRAPLPAAAE